MNIYSYFIYILFQTFWDTSTISTDVTLSKLIQTMNPNNF